METDENTDFKNSGPREIVVPGDILDEGHLRPGIGTYPQGNTIIASRVGIKSIRSNFVNVIPLGGRYVPKTHDEVIGLVVDIGPSNWLIDLNSSNMAPLHVSEVPWKVDFGDTARYLGVGDMIRATIVGLDEINRVQLSMKGAGLRKLVGGNILNVSPSKVPRIIGRGGSMISLLKEYTSCKVFVGQNGRIWVDGELSKMMLVARAIKIIEQESHTMGLTDRTRRFLEKESGNPNASSSVSSGE